MLDNPTHESVAAGHAVPEPTAEEAAQLEQLYKDFGRRTWFRCGRRSVI
jgi:gentisate 1,2-dioxygenase